MIYIIVQTITFDLTGEFMLKILPLLLLLSNVAIAGKAKIILTEENSVSFNSQVTPDYTAKKTLEILTKSAKSSTIYLVLNTPGGSVSAGLAFVDAIKSLNIKVHTITLFAASMGYQFVQELGTRYITPSGILMSHRGAVSGMSGQIPGELNSRVGLLQQILDGMSSRAAKRLGISKNDYDTSIINELWSYGEHAVKTNQADEVADVQCDKKLLNGVESGTLMSFFGSVNVTFSKCPLITVPVDVKFSKEVKPENYSKVLEFLNNQNRIINLTF